MASETVFELFDEYAARYARGEHPDAGDYLAQAGEEGLELAKLIDAFLRAAPPREPTQESVALLRARLQGEPPLLEARVRRGLKRDEVVERLRIALGLAERNRPALRHRYHELESGLLESEGVDDSVWGALAEILGADVRRLASWRPRPAAGEEVVAVYARAAAPADFRAPSEYEHDEEVDRLFLSAG